MGSSITFKPIFDIILDIDHAKELAKEVNNEAKLTDSSAWKQEYRLQCLVLPSHPPLN